jgi:hypothetical protein
MIAFAGLAALGALHGATVAIGMDGVSQLASEPPATPPLTPAQDEETLRGSFWRPERSDAVRPPAEVTPRHWSPRRGD